MELLQIAICDDDSVQRAYLRELIEGWFCGHPDLKAGIGEFSSAEAFLFAYEENKEWRLLVLDIEMKGINGMDLAKKIRQEGNDVPIVFVTGYDEYIEEGYEVAALHYLMKPLSEEKFFRVLERALHQKPEPRHIYETDEGEVLLADTSIWYIEAWGHYCSLHTKEKAYNLRCSIGTLEQSLQGRGFEKPHRSYLVNLNHVLSIQPREIILDDERRIPLSRNAYRNFHLAFLKLYGDGNEQC